MLPPREWPWRNAVGAAAVVLLHLAAIALLLRALIPPQNRILYPRETILYLAPLPPAEAERERPRSRRKAPAMKAPDYRSLIVPKRGGTDTHPLEGLGRELFDCRVENLPDLGPEARARCAHRGPRPDDSVDFADHTNRAKDAVRWAREKQRKNAPLLLPCASTQSVYATLSTATLACLANGALNGFHPGDGPIYGDRPEESHVPNNGDAPPTYSDPDH